ncbi:hypothetical protein ACFCWG_24840 [Streptomyces sp. NPDC056390]|uniref:hypothetical protein n=1 Tax=Streptomyces sp. NPDC056390 TaxID=3345806 RepID=UPI0035E05B60
MTATTIDRAELKERAIRFTVASLIVDRAGALKAPVHRKQAEAMNIAVHAGVPMGEITDEADDRLIAHILASRTPGFETVLDYDGAITERELARA